MRMRLGVWGEGRRKRSAAPNVQPGSSFLPAEVVYMATHERHHLDRALEAFEKVGHKFGVIS